MDKTYNPHALEERWYRAWEQAGYFEPSGRGEPYCIMIPPPNVTGTLHMGHAFQDTLMDALIRYRRMRGFNTLWQPGTDHAGIATQMVVERQLNAEGQTRHALGREAFVERVWAWKQTSGATITRQLRRMGASVDWSRERFTMDAGLSNAVREVFVRLYDESLIYRGKRLVNWDPVLHTALSDLEVVAQEERGHLWHMRYPFADGSGHMSVATTRPETMLGDTAVAVHPDDARYQGLIGKQVSLPLTGRTIPVIADDYVDPAFGSGCVKITPAHDFNDYRVGARHDLAAINILTSQAHINDNAPPAYRGLERFEARRRIVAELEAQGLIDKIEDHTFTVPRGDRSGEVLEPFLTDQWFVKVAPLAGPAIEAVETGRLRFVPETWTKTYFEWMHNIQDWCISRQLWWGHRIPAWYDGDGNLYVAHSEDEVRRKYGLSAEVSLEQDDDVLDTWFSSALWPFSTLGWPETTPALATFYPGSVLVTGFDIIFFWVARMIMMGLKLMDDVPFREVYIHGLVRDSEGQKMSKSKGNVLDPIDLIDGIDLDALIAKRVAGLMQPHMATQIETLTRRAYPEGIAAYGTDALRFTFAALASRGRDIKFDLGRIEGYRNFCNKLWNAARYVLMNCSSPPPQPSAGKGEADPHNSPPSSLADRQNSPSPLADRQNSPPPLAGGGREGGDPKTATPPQPDHELAWADRWIVSRLQRTEREVREYLETYRFDLAAQALYDFTWHDYCDWYLELSKPILRLAEESVPSAVEGPLPDGKALKRETEGPLCNVAARQRGTRRTLVRVLEALTRLLHPFMPFITEEIWQQVAPLAGRHGETIQHQPYPEPDDERIDAQAEHELEWVKAVIMGVRRIRSEMDIAPRKRVAVLLQHGDTGDAQRLERHAGTIKTLAGIERMEWLDGTEPPQAATALVGGMTLLIPLAGLIDIDAELARLDKEINKLENNLRKSETKLDNTEFVKRAPAEVVEKERARVQDMHGSLKQLQAQAARIRGL